MVITWGVHMLDSVRQLLGLGWPTAVSASGGRYVLDDMRETPDTLVVATPDRLLRARLNREYFDYRGDTELAEFSGWPGENVSFEKLADFEVRNKFQL
jgi:hypothetical protein